jgi:phage/conjugal plasmid C-4 type zinc finger TraR family protein
MGDIADNANDHIERELENAIRAARGVMPVDTQSAQDCVRCGMSISSARQLAVPGCQLCVDCSDEVESLRRRGLI